MTYSKSFTHILALGMMLVLLPGCTSVELASHYAKKWSGMEDQAPKTTGLYKVGNPYRVGSIWYYPEENFNLKETGIASWYGPDFHGRRTANGEIYNQNALTAAHRTLQMPAFVKVTNLENGRSVVVRVNDRGPYKHGRVIDVSRRTAELLGFIKKGTARVRLDVLPEESRKVAALAKQGYDISKVTVADIRARQVDTSAPVKLAVQSEATRGPRYTAAVRKGSADLPESLQTPTITVEELREQPQQQRAQPLISWSGQMAGTAVRSSTIAPAKPAPVAVVDNRMDVVPVKPTGLYVQAGAFSVEGNAIRLRERLSAIAPVEIEPVVVNGRTFHRVKLGPFNEVAEADVALNRVIAAGESKAVVVKNR